MKTSKAVRLAVQELQPDSFSVRTQKASGSFSAFKVYTLRWGFYYKHGRSATDFENQVKAILSEVVIIETGEVWRNFRGGAPVSQQSHFFVRFRLSEQVESNIRDESLAPKNP